MPLLRTDGREKGVLKVNIYPSHMKEEEKQELLKRIWNADPSVWSDDPAVQEKIKNRLGWLRCVPDMQEKLDEITGFATEVRNSHIKDIVLLGMGGSSLCPLVCSSIFGSSEGFPELTVLDTTDPQVIEETLQRIDPASTLFIVSSKSGTTMEPNAMFNFFWSQIEKTEAEPGKHFMAITDSGTPLEQLADEKGFLRKFINASDIGGRFSALSYFGLVPAALMGIDIRKLLESAKDMMEKCGPDVPWNSNPAGIMGEFLGTCATMSRDKLTLMADPAIKPLCLWIEQLVAESTGKDTRGLVPIVGETTGIPSFYGSERSFVYMRLENTPEEASLDAFINELTDAEFPAYVLKVRDTYDIGGMFFLWELVTTLVCYFEALNPFDEPDVLLAKTKSTQVLETYKKEGRMPVNFWVDPQSKITFRPSKLLAASMKGLTRTLRDLFQVLPTWGYLGFLPFLPYNSELEALILEMRHMVRQERGCATVMGYGPRYLHSAGQAYKGGPISAGFIIFTRKRAREYPEVPGYGVSFWHMQFAQAVGDFEALEEGNRRVIHVHLPSDYMLGMKSFVKVLSRAARL